MRGFLMLPAIFGTTMSLTHSRVELAWLFIALLAALVVLPPARRR